MTMLPLAPIVSEVPACRSTVWPELRVSTRVVVEAPMLTAPLAARLMLPVTELTFDASDRLPAATFNRM